MPEPHVVMGQRNQRDSCSQLAGLTPLALSARPLSEMPRLTSPSPQIPAEAACSEPTLLAPPPFPFSPIPLRSVPFQTAKITCLASATWEVWKGGLVGRPKAFRGSLLTAHSLPGLGLCERWCPSSKAGNPEVLQSSPCTSWGYLSMSKKQRLYSTFFSGPQLCWFPLALPLLLHVNPLSSAT